MRIGHNQEGDVVSIRLRRGYNVTFKLMRTSSSVMYMYGPSSGDMNEGIHSVQIIHKAPHKGIGMKESCGTYIYI